MASQTEQHGSYLVDMRSEVALVDSKLTSQHGARFNIRLRGMNSNHWDFKFRELFQTQIGLRGRRSPSGDEKSRGCGDARVRFPVGDGFVVSGR